MITTLWIFAYLAVGTAMVKTHYVVAKSRFADAGEVDQAISIIWILFWPLGSVLMALAICTVGVIWTLKRVLL